MFPPLYALLDQELIAELNHATPEGIAERLAAVGVELMQYRAKHVTTRQYFETCAGLMQRLKRTKNARFIVNDRADIAAISGAGGVHVGQDDLPPDVARRICGTQKWVGISTHTIAQFREALRTSADYIAFGPIFRTATKENPDRLVGTALIRKVRGLTRKPIVAIGGITIERAREVYEAGADSVAVGRDLISAANPEARATDYLAVARASLRSVRREAFKRSHHFGTILSD